MRLHHVTAAAAIAAGALAVPAGAEAATLTVQQSCAVSSLPIVVSGAGFTPNAPVTINGDAFGSATADATGSFLSQVPAPSVPPSQIAPKSVTLNATDTLNPANVATTSVLVVRDLFLTNAPLNGKPKSTTTWRFAGFVPGKPVYGHFRYKGKTQRNYRFGKAAGACGTLVSRARRLPTKSHPGKWTLQLDQRKTYSKALKLKTVISFTITRRFV